MDLHVRVDMRTSSVLLKVLVCYSLTSFCIADRSVFAQEKQVETKDASTWVYSDVPRQPFLSQIQRLQEALDIVGAPLSGEIIKQIEAVDQIQDSSQAVVEIQAILDPMCIAMVSITDSGKPDVVAGVAPVELMAQGWKSFLIKVVNPYERQGRLLIDSPNARPIPHAPAEEVDSRWMQLAVFEKQPFRPRLSGLTVEYRIVEFYSRDAGEKRATLNFAIEGVDENDPTLIKHWDFEKGVEGWKALSQVSLSAEDDAIVATSMGSDPFMGTEVEADGGPMVLQFWGEPSADGVGQVFWWTEDHPQADGRRQKSFPFSKGVAEKYEVRFDVNGKLKGLRIDPLNGPGEMKIDWITLRSGRRNQNWQSHI